MMSKPVRTHTFNGRLYKMDIGAVDGNCDQFNSNNDRFLGVYVDLNTRNGLITTIHETLHAENWSKSEADVDRVSREIGSFLWRLGYRKEGE